MEDIHQKLAQVKSRSKDQQEQCKLRHITKRRVAANQERKHRAVGVGMCEPWKNSCDHW